MKSASKLLALGCVTLSLAARAEPPRWGLGLQFAPWAAPSGHLGIPFALRESAYHLSTEITARYQLDASSAVDAAFGTPDGAMGLGGWIGYERFWMLREGEVAIELYGDPALQLGFAGPDYYARHGNSFVGFGYAYGGPWAFAVRLPAGVRARWSRLDLYAEGVPILAFTPSVEALFQLVVGVRVRF